MFRLSCSQSRQFLIHDLSSDCLRVTWQELLVDHHSIMLKRNTTKNKTKTKNKTNKTNYKVHKQHYYIDAHEIVRFLRGE